MQTTYKLVKRAYRDTKHSPAGVILIEVSHGTEAYSKNALAMCNGIWHEAYCEQIQGHQRWSISELDLGYAKKHHLDWSLRGWLWRQFNRYGDCDGSITDQQINELALEIERRAGIKNPQSWESYIREGIWFNGSNVEYPYSEGGPWWRPITT